jgi:hypothetical protein
MMHFVGNAAITAIITVLYFLESTSNPIVALLVTAIAMFVYALADLVILMSIIMHAFLSPKGQVKNYCLPYLL